MNNKKDSAVEVDLLQILRKIWVRKFLIILVASIFATVALLGSMFLITPKYTSRTRIYVVNSQKSTEETITAGDLQAGTYLTKDYQEIIMSRDVLGQVGQEYNIAPNDLQGQVSVSIPVDTRVISINVTDENPEEASAIANTLREVAANKIMSVTKVDEVTTLEVAEPSLRPSSPNIRRNAILGFLVGSFLAIMGILLSEVLDDTVKRADDIEEVLGLTLLGIVPNADSL